jgi:hypothetical protein
MKKIILGLVLGIWAVSINTWAEDKKFTPPNEKERIQICEEIKKGNYEEIELHKISNKEKNKLRENLIPYSISFSVPHVALGMDDCQDANREGAKMICLSKDFVWSNIDLNANVMSDKLEFFNNNYLVRFNYERNWRIFCNYDYLAIYNPISGQFQRLPYSTNENNGSWSWPNGYDMGCNYATQKIVNRENDYFLLTINYPLDDENRTTRVDILQKNDFGGFQNTYICDFKK